MNATPRPDFMMLEKSLLAASNRAELIRKAQDIQNFPDHWQQEQAAKIVKRKLADFKNR